MGWWTAFLKGLWQQEKPKYYPKGLNPPPMANFGTVPQEKVEDVLLAQTGLRGWVIGDAKFKITNEAALRLYCEWWRNQHGWMNYQAEFRDCDNFAAKFHGDISAWDDWCGTPNILIWSKFLGGHAYNLHVAYNADVQLQVYFIEPQTGQVEFVRPEHVPQDGKTWVILVNAKAEP